jgi:hypothetical protein
MTEIIRKPIRLYPLPDDLKELDEPYPEIIRARHTRVETFKEGYDVSSGDSPIIVPPPRSPSNILSKL